MHTLFVDVLRRQNRLSLVTLVAALAAPWALSISIVGLLQSPM